MNQWHSIDEVLDFAISEEEAAAAFYTQLAEQMAQPVMRQVFEEFAAEEKKHKEKLLAVKAGGALETPKEKVLDLKVAEYVVDVEPSAGMGYQEALIVAMKKEKAAFKLYTDLAASTKDERIKATFLALAQEEAKHKLRFEIEYDNLLLLEEN
jgi:rubrerythrin